MKYLILIFLLEIFCGQDFHYQMISSQRNITQLSNDIILHVKTDQSVVGNYPPKNFVIQQGFKQSYQAVYIAQSEQNIQKRLISQHF